MASRSSPWRLERFTLHYAITKRLNLSEIGRCREAAVRDGLLQGVVPPGWSSKNRRAAALRSPRDKVSIEDGTQEHVSLLAGSISVKGYAGKEVRFNQGNKLSTSNHRQKPRFGVTNLADRMMSFHRREV
jgi:hypothetical protein